MRILVIGNCQAGGFASCIAASVPDADVEALDYGVLSIEAREEENIARLQAADRIFSQPIEHPPLVRLREALLAANAKTTFWAGMGFDGFQPDSIYIRNPDGSFLRTPMGDYNSLIAAAGFLSGRSVADTRRLYNRLSYARLGYFDAFAIARQVAARWMRPYAYDSDAAIAMWMEEGCFMHTINHPKIAVVADLAQHALNRCGIPAAPLATLPPDPLTYVQWPVFPELAERIGIAGSMAFITHWQQPELRTLSLEQFLEGSFLSYEAAGAEVLEATPRVREAVRLLELSR